MATTISVSTGALISPVTCFKRRARNRLSTQCKRITVITFSTRSKYVLEANGPSYRLAEAKRRLKALAGKNKAGG